MNELHLRAILAGVFFGLWPLLLNRSGLTGSISATAFTLGILVIIVPFALYDLHFITINIVWSMVIGACVFGGFGLLIFNGMLSKATPQTVGSLFILMMVVQISIPAIYQIVIGGGLTVSKTIGFAAAILAAFLLG